MRLYRFRAQGYEMALGYIPALYEIKRGGGLHHKSKPGLDFYSECFREAFVSRYHGGPIEDLPFKSLGYIFAVMFENISVGLLIGRSWCRKAEVFRDAVGTSDRSVEFPHEV